ncbi:hypothetical protein JOD18_001248 [Gracilibacillus alcaliphilus]|nr:hypothetical protein [Gracilibacillus alcaliphilus]
MPVSFKFVLFVAFMYVVGTGLDVMGAASSIEYGNWLLLVFSMSLLFVGTVLLGLGTVIERDTREQVFWWQKSKSLSAYLGYL